MSGIISGFISSPLQSNPVQAVKKGIGAVGTTLWSIGSKTIGALSTATTTLHSKSAAVIKTVGSGAKSTLRKGGALAHVLYDVTQAGVRGLVGKKLSPEQAAEIWEEIFFDLVDDFVQEKVANGLEALGSVSIKDEILSVSSQQSKKMKADYVGDVSKTLQSQSGIQRKLLSSIMSAMASSIEKTSSESDQLEKNKEAYQSFCRLIVPLLQYDLDENSVKTIVGQAIGYISQMIRKFDAYTKQYQETHETFDPNTFMEGLADKFRVTSLEQVKDISTSRLTSALEKLIDKTREGSVSKNLKETVVLWATSKIPTTLIRTTVQAALETLEARLKEELVATLLPHFEKFLSVDAPQEKMEAFFTIFFWKLLVPTLIQITDSVASSPINPPEEVINRHLERAASDLIKTIGNIIQDTSFKEDATFGQIIEHFKSPKGKNTIAQLINETIKSMGMDIVGTTPLSSVKNGIENTSEAMCGTKDKLYTIVGQAVLKSIDLPDIIESVVETIKDISTH